jgi:hypothetical protein
MRRPGREATGLRAAAQLPTPRSDGRATTQRRCRGQRPSPSEQCSCLVVVEGELLVADLGKSAFHAPAVQRQWRLAATRQYHAMGWGEPLDEGGEQRPQRFVGSIVEVVDDDDEGLGDGAEFVAEDADGSKSHLTVEFDPVERVVAERRFDDADRRDQRGPEPQRVGVAAVAGHPRTSHCLGRVANHDDSSTDLPAPA